MHEFQATFGNLVIDGLAWEVTLGGVVINLTRTEFEILTVLASRPRHVVTDDELVRLVWGDGWFGDDNNLAVHVSKLRRKLGESGLHPRFIRTVRGVGYRFDPR
jgi:DNA-binding response OmpR family regulator